MTARHILTAVAAIGLCLAAGCSQVVPPGPETTPAFGSSVRMAKSRQIIDPDPVPTGPVLGLDGQKAKAAMDAYRSASDCGADSGGSENKGSKLGEMLGGDGG